jgi:hypothetical protein
VTPDRVSNPDNWNFAAIPYDYLRELKTPSDDYALRQRAGLTIKRAGPRHASVAQGPIVESHKGGIRHGRY